MGYTIISADGENWKMLEQLKDESGKVVTANLNGVCAMPYIKTLVGHAGKLAYPILV